MLGECQVNVKSQSELDIGGRETCNYYRELIFKFSDDFKGKVYVQDKRQTSTRLILDNLVRQTGDKIEIEEDQVFYMTISQTIIDKNIEDHACKRYPTSDFKNYEECDIKYMRCVTHDWFLVVFSNSVLGII